MSGDRLTRAPAYVIGNMTIAKQYDGGYVMQRGRQLMTVPAEHVAEFHRVMDDLRDGQAIGGGAQ